MEITKEFLQLEMSTVQQNLALMEQQVAQLLERIAQARGALTTCGVMLKRLDEPEPESPPDEPPGPIVDKPSGSNGGEEVLSPTLEEARSGVWPGYRVGTNLNRGV